jgi:hypothetical protein
MIIVWFITYAVLGAKAYNSQGPDWMAHVVPINDQNAVKLLMANLWQRNSSPSRCLSRLTASADGSRTPHFDLRVMAVSHATR